MLCLSDSLLLIENEQEAVGTSQFPHWIFPRFPSPRVVFLRLSVYPRWKGLRCKGKTQVRETISGNWDVPSLHLAHRLWHGHTDRPLQTHLDCVICKR